MYRVAHDEARGWLLLNSEGREVEPPHRDREYILDKAEALNMGRKQREHNRKYGGELTIG